LEFTNKLRIWRAINRRTCSMLLSKFYSRRCQESLTMSDLLPQGKTGVRAPHRLPKLADCMGEGLSWHSDSCSAGQLWRHRFISPPRQMINALCLDTSSDNFMW
jgi:hypothetical protein